MGGRLVEVWLLGRVHIGAVGVDLPEALLLGLELLGIKIQRCFFLFGCVLGLFQNCCFFTNRLFNNRFLNFKRLSFPKFGLSWFAFLSRFDRLIWLIRALLLLLIFLLTDGLLLVLVGLRRLGSVLLLLVSCSGLLRSLASLLGKFRLLFVSLLLHWFSRLEVNDLALWRFLVALLGMSSIRVIFIIMSLGLFKSIVIKKFLGRLGRLFLGEVGIVRVSGLLV